MSAVQRIVDIAGGPRHLSGWKKDKRDHRDKLLSVPFFRRLTLPSRMTLRGQPGLRPENVEDQLNIGSCTCNASTTAIEFDMLKQKELCVKQEGAGKHLVAKIVIIVLV